MKNKKPYNLSNPEPIRTNIDPSNWEEVDWSKPYDRSKAKTDAESAKENTSTPYTFAHIEKFSSPSEFEEWFSKENKNEILNFHLPDYSIPFENELQYYNLFYSFTKFFFQYVPQHRNPITLMDAYQQACITLKLSKQQEYCLLAGIKEFFDEIAQGAKIELKQTLTDPKGDKLNLITGFISILHKFGILSDKAVTDFAQLIVDPENGLSQLLLKKLKRLKEFVPEEITKMYDPFLVEDSKGNKPISKLVSEKELNDFYYWNHGIEKLQKLQAALIKDGWINDNQDFINSFKEEHVKVRQTHWKKKIPPCLYLLFLIYGSETHYKNKQLNTVAERLFSFLGKGGVGKNYTRFQKMVKNVDSMNKEPFTSIFALYTSLELPNKPKK